MNLEAVNMDRKVRAWIKDANNQMSLGAFRRILTSDYGMNERTACKFISKKPENISDVSFTKFRQACQERLGHDVSEDDLTRPLADEHGPVTTNNGVDHETTVKENPLTKLLTGLMGEYQVIWPHPTMDAYTLEAMELAVDKGEPVTYFYTYQKPDRRYLYSGEGRGAKRYYFTLMEREHEDSDLAGAYRSVSFYIGADRYTHAISGILVRGMSEQDSKEVVAVPFIAIPMRENIQLKNIDAQQIAAIHERSEPVHRLHPDSSILIGEVQRKWYSDLYDLCQSVFSNKDIRDGIQKQDGPSKEKKPILYSVANTRMKQFFDLSTDDWQKVSKLQKPKT